MGKDKRVVSMDAEAIAVIKKNKKIQHERMRQGNAIPFLDIARGFGVGVVPSK